MKFILLTTICTTVLSLSCQVQNSLAFTNNNRYHVVNGIRFTTSSTARKAFKTPIHRITSSANDDYNCDHVNKSSLHHLPSNSRRLLLRTLPVLIAPKPSLAISPQEAESSYNTYASSYDKLDGGSAADTLGIEEARNKIIGMAKGNVLEIGAGTGLNLKKYKFASSTTSNDGVTSLTSLDISDGMLSEAKEKVRLLENVPSFVEFNFVKADATSSDVETLFGGKGTFDTVVDTFSLCVMGTAGAKNCLLEMRNMVKPKEDGGLILLIENTRSSNPLLGWYQDATADMAATMGGKGCVSNQDVKSFIEQIDGLTILKEEEYAAGLFRSFVCSR